MRTLTWCGELAACGTPACTYPEVTCWLSWYPGVTAGRCTVAWADVSARLTRRGAAAKAAARWPEVMAAVRVGDRRLVALTSTLPALIRSGALSPLMITCPDGWLRATVVCAGTLSR
jgi:hypothetical protein